GDPRQDRMTAAVGDRRLRAGIGDDGLHVHLPGEAAGFTVGHQAPITHGRGHTILSGIAWSGRGTIAEVHVTTDGGMNWQRARLDGPSWDKSMHRFYYEFDWDGSPLLLQSRAIDSTGAVQPTKDQLRKVRGVNSIYHNNGIQTWAVDTDGRAENVEIS
ncbi:MAG: hypothetical protein AAFR44_13145, partial [Pseudomonadota bacterium]